MAGIEDFDSVVSSAKHGFTEADRSVLCMLFDGLVSEDREAFKAILCDNPDLAEGYLDENTVVHRVREALLADVGAGSPPEYAQIVAQIDAKQADPYCDRTAKAKVLSKFPADKPRNADGILTILARQLSPEKALELYRKIAPLLVFEMLKLLDRSTRLEVVHQVAEHLCSESVQKHLRQCEHVRDGIVEELSIVLRDTEVEAVLTKETLLDILEDCGAMGDLIAMENCIKLSKVKAG